MNDLTDTPRLVTLNKASEIWGIPLWTLRKAVQNKKIPHTRRLGRIYISVKKFEDWLKDGEVNPRKHEG